MFILKPNTIQKALIEYEMSQTGCNYDHAEKKVLDFLERKKDPYKYDLKNVFNKKISDLKDNYFS